MIGGDSIISFLPILPPEINNGFKVINWRSLRSLQVLNPWLLIVLLTIILLPINCGLGFTPFSGQFRYLQWMTPSIVRSRRGDISEITNKKKTQKSETIKSKTEIKKLRWMTKVPVIKFGNLPVVRRPCVWGPAKGLMRKKILLHNIFLKNFQEKIK